ncbi:hypothetical protein [Cyanobium sp. WAJ14-Wanaka]|uniref:hypothetical protein n=1 Tax=Cyanobium sp. WAJ14-Wanaka TaxID=2823725 RepID=UPI0020CCD054|nr:hypothetical protein [Cyanobium sp. WAJ14-Wanaka]MCP9774634.1 hypothetical protein [Cyanobium sp. WAJ14-Wanaka]
MGPKAILTFSSQGSQPPLNLLLPAGRPQDVAAWLAATIACEGLLPSEIRGQACGIDCSYQYRLEQKANGISLECWRRYPNSSNWQRRCGPMQLEQFIQRFQPTCAAHHASS